MTSVVIDARKFRSRMQKLGMLIESKEITKLAGLDILAFVADNFQTEGASGGSPWQPLSPFTIARRRKGRGGGGIKILQDTGRLKQSFISGRPDNVFRQFGGKGIDVGTTVSYAPKHEFGDSGPPRIPQRKMLPTRDRAQEIAAKSIEAIIRERTRRI
jgi:phage gpG-like protein